MDMMDMKSSASSFPTVAISAKVGIYRSTCYTYSLARPHFPAGWTEKAG
jgi:hypothetical protein